MSGVISVLKGLAPLVLAGGICAALLAMYRVVTADQFILTCLGAVALIIVVILAPVFIPHRDEDDAVEAEAHLKPLRQPGAAEKTLETDLRDRGMLLQHGGITRRRADRLARKVLRRTVRDRIGREAPQRGKHAAPPRAPRALDRSRDTAQVPTETLGAIPAMPATLPLAVPYTPTEPMVVRLADAMKPDTAYEGWTTGQFEMDIKLLGAEDTGGAA